MFQFGPFAFIPYEFRYEYYGFTIVGFPIRISPQAQKKRLSRARQRCVCEFSGKKRVSLGMIAASRTVRAGIGSCPGRRSRTFSSRKNSRLRSICPSRRFRTHEFLSHYTSLRNDSEMGSNNNHFKSSHRAANQRIPAALILWRLPAGQKILTSPIASHNTCILPGFIVQYVSYISSHGLQ